MTTGCTCGTPGCDGITYWPGDRCARCRNEATPSALKRAVLRLLDGPQLAPGGQPGQQADREAGS
jgi:hypothetical protein